MSASTHPRGDWSRSRAPLVIVVLSTAFIGTESTSHGRSRARRNHSAPLTADTRKSPPPAGDAAFVYVKGTGILRLHDGEVATILPTQAPLRDMQLDGEGALWVSLRDVGVVRHAGGKTVTVNQESFAKLAIRSPTDVWTINDRQGSVVHYDGTRWKTVRTRNSLAGAFEDNRLLDIVSDGRAVWVSSWNGLWRVTNGRWTRVEPPPVAPTEAGAELEVSPAPSFPLSLHVSQSGLIACFPSGCFLSTDVGWQSSHGPADKAHLQRTGAANLLAGSGADGKTVVIASMDGASAPSTSDALPPTGINDIAIDATGRVWVATLTALTVLDSSGHKLQQWKAPGGSGQPGEIERVVIAGAGPKELPEQ